MPTEANEEPTAAPKVDEPDHSNRLDPWIEDGNIVLAVQGKYFRVHRSILSSYSEVFKDMFQSVEPSEGVNSELIEQCPVVHLHDQVVDVQIVLKAMYDRSYPLPYWHKAQFSVVSTFLRLGEKYNMEQFTKEAKARLCCAFEPSLQVAAKISSSKSFVLFQGISGGDPHNFQVMNLLREMDLKAPLPLAMYQCVMTCPLNAIVDGYTFNDSVCSLSRANLESWILIKNILDNFRIRLVQSLHVSYNCVVQSSCVLVVRRVCSDEIFVKQPFCPWRLEWDKLFCNSCKADLNALRNAEILKAWNQIPTAFGFNSWAEVEENNDFPQG